MDDLGKQTETDGEGPQCPRCGAVYTADGEEFFNEAQGLKLQCSCGAHLSIQPEITTTWTTTIVAPGYSNLES